ncbi:polysaccharide deacetylase family protein, partial [Saccharothrix algeriensis]
VRVGSSFEARRLARPVEHLFGGVAGSVCAVRTETPHVVLTYDDGPEPGGTGAVLAALADFHATATFFVLLTRARRFPRLLGEIVSAGHEIALHGVDHRRLTQFPGAEVERRTRAGRAELEDLTGRRVAWFRPPYGAQSLRTWRAVVRAGLVPVLWGPTLRDTSDVPQADRVASALRGSRAGAIVLGHDGLRGAGRRRGRRPRAPGGPGRADPLAAAGPRRARPGRPVAGRGAGRGRAGAARLVPRLTPPPDRSGPRPARRAQGLASAGTSCSNAPRWAARMSAYSASEASTTAVVTVMSSGSANSGRLTRVRPRACATRE